MSTEKTYWIGDDGDSKSVSIAHKIYTRGEEIPAEKVDNGVLDGWIKRGLVSIGSFNPAIITKGGSDSSEPSVEIEALEKEVKELKAELAKVKDGAKAKRLKELEAENKMLSSAGDEAIERIAELERDVAEKAALIDKQALDIEALTSPGTTED